MTRFALLQAVCLKSFAWRRAERQRKRYEARVAGVVRARFREDRKAVIADLRQAGTTRGVIDAVPDAVARREGAWTRALTRVLAQTITDVAVVTFRTLESGKAAGDGERVDRWRELAREHVGETLPDTLQAVSATTVNRIQGALYKAIDEGASIDQMVTALSARWDSTVLSATRARMIARTETVDAAGFGSLQGARESQADVDKKWLAAGDHRTRTSHLMANGQVRGLDAPFDVGGSHMQHPGDRSLGAEAEEVVNCRCAVGFVRRR